MPSKKKSKVGHRIRAAVQGSGAAGGTSIFVLQFLEWIKDIYPDMPDSTWPWLGTAMMFVGTAIIHPLLDKYNYVELPKSVEESSTTISKVGHKLKETMKL